MAGKSNIRPSRSNPSKREVLAEVATKIREVEVATKAVVEEASKAKKKALNSTRVPSSNKGRGKK